MLHGTKSGLVRLRRPVAMLGAVSVALILGGTALLVPTVTEAKVGAGCVSKCDRRLASALVFCARSAELAGDPTRPDTDGGAVSACEQRAAVAHDTCVAACGVPGDPF